MAAPEAVPCAASSLLRDLVDARGAPPLLVEVARTWVSVHYETGRDDVPVLCLGTPGAVRLPASVTTPVLPSGPVTVLDGALTDGATAWRVVRWWQPPRPSGMTPPVCLSGRGEVRGGIVPAELVGRGPGLTPSGDDVLAGALVAAHATSDPRLGRWRVETREALRVRRTTAVSRGLLHHALDGYATPELADFLVEACSGGPGPATARLLAVGHGSGAALAAGVRHVLATSGRAAA